MPFGRRPFGKRPFGRRPFGRRNETEDGQGPFGPRNGTDLERPGRGDMGGRPQFGRPGGRGTGSGNRGGRPFGRRGRPFGGRGRPEIEEEVPTETMTTVEHEIIDAEINGEYNDINVL